MSRKSIFGFILSHFYSLGGFTAKFLKRHPPTSPPPLATSEFKKE